MVTERDIRTVAEILKEAAQREILPRFRRLGTGDIRTKSSAIDLVTDADEQAERLIEARLAAAFPGVLVVGEEGVSKGAGRLKGLGEADLAILVDPVDGTANFAAGLPLFAVMAALVVRGEIVGTVILDALSDMCSFALRGEGAWWEDSQGRRTDMRVAPPVPVSQMVGTVSWHWTPEPKRSILTGNLGKVATALSYRCAAHEYRLVASGNTHFVLFSKLMPWDHAPGWLLHREAGGYAARFDGSPYGVTHLDGGLIAAPDKDSWTALRDALLNPSEPVA
ncbi:inositol monophosphatase family protein [Alsobacter sp. R-9]